MSATVSKLTVFLSLTKNKKKKSNRKPNKCLLQYQNRALNQLPPLKRKKSKSHHLLLIPRPNIPRASSLLMNNKTIAKSRRKRTRNQRKSRRSHRSKSQRRRNRLHHLLLRLSHQLVQLQKSNAKKKRRQQK